MAVVGYLDVPKDIEEEWATDWEGTTPSVGMTQFVWGNPDELNSNNVFIKPQVGDLFIFPSNLQHIMYPFLNSSGEYRSFNLNLNLTSSLKEQTDEIST